MATLPAARFLVPAMSSVRICVQQVCAGQEPMGPEYKPRLPVRPKDESSFQGLHRSSLNPNNYDNLGFSLKRQPLRSE
jgi:hypothetical protein